MLTDGEIDAFHKRRIDLPATGSEHIMDGGQCAEDHTVAQPHEAPAPHGLDHLGIEQVGQGHPARLGRSARGLAALRMHPVAEMSEQGGRVFLEAVGEEQRHTPCGQDLHHLMDDALGHHQRAGAHLDGQQLSLSRFMAYDMMRF